MGSGGGCRPGAGASAPARHCTIVYSARPALPCRCTPPLGVQARRSKLERGGRLRMGLTTIWFFVRYNAKDSWWLLAHMVLSITFRCAAPPVQAWHGDRDDLRPADHLSGKSWGRGWRSGRQLPPAGARACTALSPLPRTSHRTSAPLPQGLEPPVL